ncbi:hypothetical protein P280DRAFT_470758 [Massarina eburnea CBS 473.64]|uniref:Uncharacterized protein n=1 Tax=Massarina eburnea CBS 473.64 TaxID=1395130 RepID=A0A6A6RXB6_9PLEO|nr:hypothetical protein P280DRAFT_470758 [Massarina eburnea CBS 473.64]
MPIAQTNQSSRSPDPKHLCMAYSDFDSYTHRPRHDSYYSKSRDADPYCRPSDIAADGRADMRYSSSPYHDSYEPRYTLPSRPVQPRYRPSAYNSRWPPGPSVEEESASLAREFPSAAGEKVEEGDDKSRGSVDQYPIIEELEQPPYTAQENSERRFVLVSDPSADDSPPASHAAKDGRRKSFAERGNMPYLKTDMKDPPVFTERTSTPYAYTKPQKESLAPDPAPYVLSPEGGTPESTSVPRSVPSRGAWDEQDESDRPERRPPPPPRHESFAPSPTVRTSRSDVFEESDGDSDGVRRRTEPRRTGRYSFVKSDFLKEDLRANVRDSQAKSDKRKHHDASREPAYASNSSSGSSKHPTPQTQSPRSSSSSLNGESRRHNKPAPVETSYTKSSRYPDTYFSTPRPESPSYRERPSPPRSPRLPPRQASPTTSRPTSRNGPRPPSPLSFSNSAPRPNPHVPVTESDWHATYPPATDRARPISRHERYETMPAPMPHINVKSPSPARPLNHTSNPLPYPVEDRFTEAFMPTEENYQYDHSSTPTYSSPRQSYPETYPPASPRLSAFRPAPTSRHSTNVDDVAQSSRVRSGSNRSQSSHDGRRERKMSASPAADRPLPSCPRSEPSTKYNDWYSMENCPNFDICPSCYEGVFADTPFAVYFSQLSRRYERPIERYCDFSSPWMRLAWHITIKQRRQVPDLMYALANIIETERPCPEGRELTTDQIVWYGIPDQRDGIHVANFAVCPCDLKMMEVLFPSIRGYFTRLPTSSPYTPSLPYTCSLRFTSRRFPKYLELLIDLDNEAQVLGQRPNINRFVQLARENAFKSECQKGKSLFSKPWHFMPQLSDFTVCQECFEEVVWPAITAPPTPTISSSPYTSVSPSTLPRLFNRTIQPVPMEDPETGSSCYLHSPRMRSIWERAVADDDFGYLKRNVIERKIQEKKSSRERRGLMNWMNGLERGGREWERGRMELKIIDREWAEVE